MESTHKTQIQLHNLSIQAKYAETSPNIQSSIISIEQLYGD